MTMRGREEGRGCAWSVRGIQHTMPLSVYGILTTNEATTNLNSLRQKGNNIVVGNKAATPSRTYSLPATKNKPLLVTITAIQEPNSGMFNLAQQLTTGLGEHTSNIMP